MGLLVEGLLLLFLGDVGWLLGSGVGLVLVVGGDLWCVDCLDCLG